MAVFDQNEVWTDQDGDTVRLDQMDDEDRLALADWLMDHADYFYVRRLAHELIGFDTWASGDPAVPPMLFLSADEWMSSTRLVRALRPRWQGSEDRV